MRHVSHIQVAAMAQARVPQTCCLPHPGIGFHILTSQLPSRLLPHLLGLTDEQLQERMAKGHPYAFNMGHGKIIPFNDYEEATKALMERNMPEVLQSS